MALGPGPARPIPGESPPESGGGAANSLSPPDATKASGWVTRPEDVGEKAWLPRFPDYHDVFSTSVSETNEYIASVEQLLLSNMVNRHNPYEMLLAGEGLDNSNKVRAAKALGASEHAYSATVGTLSTEMIALSNNLSTLRDLGNQIYQTYQRSVAKSKTLYRSTNDLLMYEANEFKYNQDERSGHPLDPNSWLVRFPYLLFVVQKTQNHLDAVEKDCRADIKETKKAGVELQHRFDRLVAELCS